MQTAIIADLLDIARISGCKLPLELEPMPPERTIIAAIDDMQPAIIEKCIRLSMDQR